MTDSPGQKDGSLSELVRWRRLVALVGERPRGFILAAFLSLAGALLEGASAALLLPTLEGALRRDFGFLREHEWAAAVLGALPFGAGRNDVGVFVCLVLAIFVCVVLRLALQYAAAMVTARGVWTFLHALRLRLLERYLARGKRFFDEHNAGYLRSVLMVLPTQMASSLQATQATLYWVGALCVYVALMWAVSWQLSLVVCLLFPLLYGSVGALVRRIRSTSEAQSEVFRRLNESTHDVLSSVLLVQATNQEAAERARFDALGRRYNELFLRQARRQHAIHPLQELLVVTAVLLLVGVVGLLLGRSDAGSVSGFLVFFYLLRRAATTFSDLNRVRGVLGQLSGPLNEVLAQLEEASAPDVPDGEREFAGLRERIRFRDLTFSYPNGTPALRGVDFALEKGKTTAIVGRTGSGKTTLAYLLLRFYDVPPESIFVDDVDIREFRIASLRERIAYVSQDAFLFDDTLRNNITYGLPEVTDDELAEVLRKACLDELCARHPEGLDVRIGDRGVKLSGGEKQRIALARAMLRKADLLVLDEATSALDVQTERKVQRAIDETLRDRTALVIAHRLSTIQEADWIVLLEEGRVVEQGRLDELIARDGPFSVYWKTQFGSEAQDVVAS